MATHRYCDGLKRRDFMKVGALGASFTLADYLRLAKAGTAKSSGKAQAAIYIRLGGGPTHMDTFDMKPDAPAEYRGELKPIKTNAPGVEICEKFPLLAKTADKFTILRGVSHTLAAHELGSKYLLTGNRPLPSLEYPGIGSVVNKELSSPADMPSYVAIPNSQVGGGFLGLQYGPFATNNTPKLGQTFNVRGIGLQGGITLADVERREKLLASVDTAFRDAESKSDVLSGLDEFSQQAYNMISSKRAREAFDLSRENSKTVERFGDGDVNQSALLAVRLIEAGARFITLTTGNWDMHRGIYERLNTSLPMIDRAVSALLTTLDERGLLESTAVIMTGEFGRTPKINANAGRDHWPRAMFVFLAGGGMKTGQVIGASNDKGEGPADRTITPNDVAASLFHSLGIDHHKEYQTSSGRPIMINRDGNIIPELFA